MTVRVYVFPKATVLDPQGQAVRNALVSQGHQAVAQVRQGKVFDLQLEGVADAAAARAEGEQIAHDVLANPVIESYRVEVLA
jgi:phosphoribosylformylglycinamidine synthase PurS subunit